MTTNFEIKENYALNFEGRHIDLHNNFNFTGFRYDVVKCELVLSWLKSTGDWVGKDELNALTLTHLSVSFLNILNTDTKNADAHCLADLGYNPSSERGDGSAFTTQSVPEEGDDIIYNFQNGETIQIGCAEITLTVESH